MQNTVLPVYMMIGAPLLVVAKWGGAWGKAVKMEAILFQAFQIWNLKSGNALKHDKKMTSAPAYHLTMRMESYVQ